MFKKALFRIYLIVLITSFIGCGSSKDLEKTNSTINTQIEKTIESGNLQIKIPLGWREIKDNHNQLFDIWIINDDKTASIVFVPIFISEEIAFNKGFDKFEVVEKIVLSKKKATSDEFEILDKQILGGELDMKSIRYMIDGAEHNSIIFGKKNVFYESQAYFKEDDENHDLSIDDLAELQRIIVENAVFN
jgi:hypothetical protein